MRCSKVFLIILNSIVGLGALVVLGLGVALMVKATAVTTLGLFFVVVGCGSFLIALFGFCGACQENKCMLITYSVLMVLLMLASIAVPVVVFGFTGTLVKTLASGLEQNKNVCCGQSCKRLTLSCENVAQMILGAYGLPVAGIAVALALLELLAAVAGFWLSKKDSQGSPMVTFIAPR